MAIGCPVVFIGSNFELNDRRLVFQCSKDFSNQDILIPKKITIIDPICDFKRTYGNVNDKVS